MSGHVFVCSGYQFGLFLESFVFNFSVSVICFSFCFMYYQYIKPRSTLVSYKLENVMMTLDVIKLFALFKLGLLCMAIFYDCYSELLINIHSTSYTNLYTKYWS